jgi:hypothetical protein
LTRLLIVVNIKLYRWNKQKRDCKVYTKKKNIPMEKLLEVLETHLETCHKMLATYDTAANELKAVYDKIDLFDDLYNSKF